MWKHKHCCCPSCRWPHYSIIPAALPLCPGSGSPSRAHHASGKALTTTGVSQPIPSGVYSCSCRPRRACISEARRTSLPRRLFKVVGFSPKLHSAACGRLRRLIDPIPRLCLASPGHHRAICLFSPPSLPLDPTHTRRRRALLPLHRTRTQARRLEVACILYIHCRGGIQTPGRNGVGTPFPTPRFSRLPTRQVAEAVTVSLAAHPCRVIGDQRFCL